MFLSANILCYLIPVCCQGGGSSRFIFGLISSRNTVDSGGG